ncbi:MAG: ABC transporter substrate-binding protein [Thaumarchaeota archaeon]|nr:ABC transporter substrate-binding protein [Candidatus Calditenuaceae archaeon]MDW8186754.1 ABC transporter substrate-binding protein [Nitrososphaerota archaeon]
MANLIYWIDQPDLMSQTGSVGRTSKTITVVLIVASLVVGLLSGVAAAPVIFPPVTQFRTITQIQTTQLITTATAVVVEPTIKYAKLFTIERRDGFTVLRDGANRTILLVPRGRTAPDVRADLVVTVPVERMVLMSATHVALIERLREYAPELLTRVKGIMWGNSYRWFFPEIDGALKDGRIADVGAAFSPNYEAIVALRPDLVMIYTYPGDPIPSKLAELKLPYVVNSEYLEDTLLGRFEWIKFVGAFLGLDEEARTVFRFVETSYQLTAEKVTGAIDAKLATPKKIVWFSVFRGTVYVAAGGSYVAKAIGDLKGVYAFSDIRGTGSGTVTLEELVRRAADADVIMLSTDLVASLDALLAEVPGLAGSKAVREGRVFRYNSNIFQLGYYDTEGWFRDLAAVLYPELFKDHQLSYYVRLR